MRSLPPYSPSCCTEPCAIQPEYLCLFPDIIDDYKKLWKLYEGTVTKRQRILDLAFPKRLTTKYRPECKCPDVALRKIEILRTYEPEHTRTEQLAYPKPRNLFTLKQDPIYCEFSTERKKSVNRLLRKSLMSLYSRLSNTKPPKPAEKQRQLSIKEVADHMKRISSLARPKSLKEPEELPRTSGVPNDRRLKKLSRPKKYEDTRRKPWSLTNKMRAYQPTQRILELSTSTKKEKFDPEEVYRVKKSAMEYIASSRISYLATPAPYIQFNQSPTRKNAFKVSPAALRAESTPRTVQLSEPKQYFDSNSRSNPFKVKRAALRAKTSNRTRELAKPKVYAK